MRTRTVVLLMLAAAVSLVVAGCGSSSSSSSSSTSAPSSSSTSAASTSTPSTTSTSAASTTTSSSASGGSGGNSAVAAAAKQGCEAAISNNPALAADKRGALSADCVKVANAAATGDKATYKKAYLMFCGDLAAALPTAAQGPAKAACDQAANSLP